MGNVLHSTKKKNIVTWKFKGIFKDISMYLFKTTHTHTHTKNTWFIQEATTDAVFTWISSRSVTQARARVRQDCRAKILGSLTGISWASFTIASRVERGCFCLEQQNHDKKKADNFASRDTGYVTKTSPAAGTVAKFHVTRLTFALGRSVPSPPSVLLL